MKVIHSDLSEEALCAAGALFRMKKNAVDYTCGRKIPRTKTESHTKARKLEEEAALGRLEEPLIVAPILEARRGNYHDGKTPSW